MFELNRLFKIACLTSGIFNGEKIVKNKTAHFLHLFAIFVCSLEAVKVVVVLSHPHLKYHLPVLYLTKGKMSQRLFTMCTFLVHVAFVYNHVYFYKFNFRPKEIQFLRYLLYKIDDDFEIKLKNEYHLEQPAAIQVKKLISLENKFSFAWVMQNMVSVSFALVIVSLVARCLYLPYQSIERGEITEFEFYAYSVPLSLTLFSAFMIESQTTVCTFLIFIVNCKFLQIWLADLIYKFEKIYSDVQDKKFKSIKTLKIEIDKLTDIIDLVLDFQRSTQKLANNSIAGFYVCVLLIALFFPFLMLFEDNESFYKFILISIYVVIMFSVCITIAYSNTSVTKMFMKLRYEKNSFQLLVSTNEKKSKLVRTLSFFYDLSDDEVNFNCLGLFRYTYSFVLEWVLNSITMVFLLYGIQFNVSITPTN